jgi:hypothetical protein
MVAAGVRLGGRDWVMNRPRWKNFWLKKSSLAIVHECSSDMRLARALEKVAWTLCACDIIANTSEMIPRQQEIRQSGTGIMLAS